MLIEEKAEGGDMLAQIARERPAFFDGYRAACARAPGVALYRRAIGTSPRTRLERRSVPVAPRARHSQNRTLNVE